MLGIIHQKGVNLIELLVVTAIVIILTLAAIPLFTEFMQEYRLKSAVQSLYYSMQYARSEAVKENQTIYVGFQTGDSWCYGINPSTICTCSTPSGCSLGTTTAPRSQSLTLTATGLTTNALQFEGTRGAAGASSVLTFTVYGGTQTMSIKVTGLGNMTICSPNVSGYPACS
ncbi:MAG: GspH/FimT family pseudopilin [Gammaproteobacteria bacterium]|nr:GspH/FimT family pseudopilin [Gammaproteobacteria bacterium]